jgi:hypothetical protein
MNSFADKIQENKKQTASHTVTQKKRSAAVDLQFNNNHGTAVAQMQLLEIANNSEQVKQAVQLQTMVNANSTLSIQKKGVEEEELQMKAAPIQRQGIEEEEPLQGKFALPIQKKANNTGLPDDLKSGIENLSGFAMDDVKVHYNSPEPAQLQAHAYAQGTDIHIASGQEKHLPHEAWHVVQQKQGRVQPTLQMKGNVNVNDNAGLENEADVMGTKAFQFVDKRSDAVAQLKKELFQKKDIGSVVIQKFDAGIGEGWHIHYGNHVKYDSNNDTRVNFGGRTRRQIGYAWEEKINEHGLMGTKETADFISCKTWMRNNLV